MRLFVSLLVTSLLLASKSFTQGLPPWTSAQGGQPGNGESAPHAVDPLASGNHWSPMPGPAMPPNNGATGGGWRPFGSPGGQQGVARSPGPSQPGQDGGIPTLPFGASGGGIPGMPSAPGAGASGMVQGGGDSQLKQETEFPGQPTKALMVSVPSLRACCECHRRDYTTRY